MMVGIGGHLLLACVIVWILASGCPSQVPVRDDGTSVGTLPHDLDRLRPLAKRMGPMQPGDWLVSHDEAGQTYEEWRASSPVRPTGQRTVLYIQPIGDFSPAQRKIVELSAEFMQLYFSRPVKFLPDLPLARIPQRARRVHPSWGNKQILSTYVLDEVLHPALPKDAVASIAFTASDLWPGRGWNFVFGQASLRYRVGVWSIHRNGDPADGAEAFRTCLLRTIKTATHETGHMLSIAHCIAYECNMCGCNNREEADRRPLACCPECVAKICDATEAAPLPRYEKLADWCGAHQLTGAERDYRRFTAALSGE